MDVYTSVSARTVDFLLLHDHRDIEVTTPRVISKAEVGIVKDKITVELGNRWPHGHDWSWRAHGIRCRQESDVFALNM